MADGPVPLSVAPPPPDPPPREAPLRMPSPPPPTWQAQAFRARTQLFGAFFFAVFLFLLYQLYQVLSPFLAPMIWAVILALATYPAYDALLQRFQGRATLAATVMTLLITAAIIVPTVSLSSVVSRESISLYGQVTEMVRSGRVNQMVEDLRQSTPGRWVERVDRQLEINWPQIVQRIADATSSQVTAFARNVAVFLVDLLLMLFTIFFVFRDGSAMQRALRDLLPMDADHKDAIFHRLYETLSAVMRGMLVTAVVQGILTGVGLYVLGVPYAAFLGVVAGLFALIPLIGPGAVWLPAAIYLWVVDEGVRALILAAWGTLAIGGVDNFLRPLLIGGAARLPTLFLFFGMLGGLQVYGFLGIFLGPVLLAIVMAFVDIYREEYAGPADEPPPLAPPPPTTA